ncbi:MAG: chemotaxis protein CheW [Leptospiraceae bacterium]|nr:chemotaxis protein CheW [Leptospiraceae bacterium]
MAGILGEYTELFLEESEDQIEELNSNLLLLENDHHNQNLIDDIFRAAHSLKSSAAFVGLYHLSDLSHKMENLLQKIREGSLEVNTRLVTLLFKCFDLIKNSINKVSDGIKVDEPFSDMIALLDDYEKNPDVADSSNDNNKPSNNKSNPNMNSKQGSQAKQGSEIKSKSSQAKTNSDALVISLDDVHELHQEISADPSLNLYKIRIILKADTPMKGLRFTLILQNLKTYGIIFKSKPTEEELESGYIGTSLYFVFLSKKREAEIHESANIDMVETIHVNRLKLPELPKKKEGSSQATKNSTESQDKTSTIIQNAVDAATQDNDTPQGDKAISDSKIVLKSIKVSSDKLDQLMNNVGELVITNSGFQKIYDDLIALFGDDTLFNDLKLKVDQINRISKDLQTGIMNIRMVPIGSVFNRFTRLVRDLSLETNKKVNLILKGENTELDKKVIDAIGEPLIHLIRNSIDHGIELPNERMKRGKDEYGTVELNAYQGGSNIMVEIRDDGKGLSRSKILEKAISSGLVTKEEASSLSDNDVYQFIFNAGFSTAEKITDISGRGVGMNVVNKLVQEFKGKIIINSQEGIGTSFTLSFPQALAIIPSILVIMEEEVYAFPLSEVSETIKVNLEQITTLEGHEIINLRGEVLPIYRLNRIIGLANRNDLTELPVIIVNYKSRKLGFIVDDLIGKHETVIKSLAKNYKNVPGLTGATIMGDGTIILVLDIPGLIELASSDDLTDTSTLGFKEMFRTSSVRSLETSDSEKLLKTSHATNIFNEQLYDLRSKDKSKNKRDRNRNDSQNGRTAASARKQLEKTNQAILDKAESREQDYLIMDEAAQSKLQKNETLQTPQSASAPLTIEGFSLGEIPPGVDVQSPPDELYSHLESKVSSEDEEHKRKASEIIKGFIEQKNERIKAVQPSQASEVSAILNQDQLRKLESIMNTGMMNAAMVLSQLVGKEVELFVPDISLTDKEGLARDIRYSDEKFFGMKIRMNGDLNGNLLMMFSEENGRNVAKELLRSKDENTNSILSDDSISVLGEISNIVCAGVINSLSNKTKTEILPSVPEFITGSFIEVLDIVKPERTKFLSMHTEFNQEGNNLLGLLLFLPDFDELVELISKIK